MSLMTLFSLSLFQQVSSTTVGTSPSRHHASSFLTTICEVHYDVGLKQLKLLFQVVDETLDVTKTSSELANIIEKDLLADKITYPKVTDFFSINIPKSSWSSFTLLSKRKHTVRCGRESTAPETLLTYRSRLISCNVSSTIHSYCS
ncbi:hypothetical protein L1887_20523 [Cichorium endivia]|nr:hypothetical protein L1887_20523 [Cichorium endivia]